MTQLTLFDPIEIPLTKGQVAIVDPIDSDLAALKWTELPNHSGGIYLRKGTKLLHRIILSRMLGRELTTSEEVDHRNRNTLDNRRCNLRLATRTDNARNQRGRTQGYKGVRRNRSGFWQARITVNTVEIALGDYDTVEEAAIAYNHAAQEYFGDFAAYNEIPGWQSIHPSRRIEYASLRKDNNSGYPNINYHKRLQKWQVRARVNGKRIHLGYFATPEEAHAAYLEAARKYAGAFARGE